MPSVLMQRINVTFWHVDGFHQNRRMGIRGHHLIGGDDA